MRALQVELLLPTAAGPAAADPSPLTPADLLNFVSCGPCWLDMIMLLLSSSFVTFCALAQFKVREVARVLFFTFERG